MSHVVELIASRLSGSDLERHDQARGVLEILRMSNLDPDVLAQQLVEATTRASELQLRVTTLDNEKVDDARTLASMRTQLAAVMALNQAQEKAVALVKGLVEGTPLDQEVLAEVVAEIGGAGG